MKSSLALSGSQPEPAPVTLRKQSRLDWEATNPAPELLIHE